MREDCDRTASHKLAVVNALCHYCQEAVNRIRVRDGSGLELMLSLLGRTDYSLIHNRLISALVCFLYDEASIETLLQSGLVGVLVSHLRRCARIPDTSADTGLGLSDDECADLVLGPESTEVDPGKQEDGDWLTSENLDEHARQLTLKEDDDCTVIESVSRCEINYNEDDEETEDMLACGNSEGEVEAAFSDVSSPSYAASTEMVDAVSSGSGVDAHNHGGNNTVDCCGSSSSQKLIEMASETDVDAARTSGVVAASDNNDGLSCALSVASPVRSVSSQAKGSDEAEEEANPGPRYSIDSPTYKAVASWKTETSYSGPRNIMESAEYYGSASPGGLYGYYSPPRWSPYSPMSTTSYPSPVASPGSSPQRPDSPTALIDVSFLSTYPTTFSGGTSPVHGATSQLDWSPDGGMVQQALTTPVNLLEWSPVQQSSEPVSGDDNVAQWEAARVTDSVITAAVDRRRRSADDVFNLGLSCSMQPPTDDDTRTGSATTDVGPCRSTDYPPCPHDLSKKRRPGVVDVPCDLLAADAACSVGDRADGDGATSAAPSPPCRGGTVKPTGQRKRSFAPDTISKIRKIVDASTPNSLVDIGDLMNRGRADMEPTPPDAYDRHRQPGKVTEHNILILLSRVSYMTDPSSYLLSGDALRGLLEYASLACLPLSRGARILQRVTRNPHCFEPIIRALIPSHIDRILGPERPIQPGRSCRPTAGEVGNVAKQLFQSERCNTPEQHPSGEAREKPSDMGTVSSKKTIAMDADDVLYSSSKVPVAAEVSERDTGGLNRKSVDENKCAEPHLEPAGVMTASDTITGGDRHDVSNDTTELKRCLLTNLSLLSESRYGRGVISHILLTGCDLDKLKIATSLPFLCR